MVDRSKSQKNIRFMPEKSSDLFNSSCKLSLLTVDFNKTYSKAFQNIQNFSNKHSIEHKLETIKKALKIKHPKIEFDEIVSNLEVITNEIRFLKQRMELTEKISERGYLEKGSSQFFELPLKGNPSPVRISVEVHKGKIEGFISLTNSSPNKDFHDKKLDSDLIEVHSRFNIFIENKCYLAVYALLDSRISVNYYFKPGNEINFTKRESKKQILDHKYDHEIKAMRENPELKAKFEKKIQEIIKKRKNNEKLNFIHINRSLVSISISNETLSTQIKLKNQEKIAQVKKRKILINEKKTAELKAKLMKKQIKLNAEKRAQEMQRILIRKENTEKKWLVLIYAINALEALSLKQKELKAEKIRKRILQLKVYSIQKCFFALYPKSFSLQYRIKALARNHLLLYNASCGTIAKKTDTMKTVNFIKQALVYRLTIEKFNKFTDCCINIQRSWRKYSKENSLRVAELLKKWNKVAQDTVLQLIGIKSRKKKKNQSVEKILSIPIPIREKLIRELLWTCKLSLLNEIRSGKKIVKLNYNIDDETIKKMIFKVVEENKKLHKKNTNSHDKKSNVIN
jgi:hypothetical protein